MLPCMFPSLALVPLVASVFVSDLSSASLSVSVSVSDYVMFQ